jgi:hypothetical protein
VASRSAKAFALRMAAVVLALRAVAAQDAIFFRDPKAKELFTNGRIAAFGAPGGVARLRSIVFKGTSRIPVSDGSLAAGTVEIRVLDSFVCRRDGHPTALAWQIGSDADGERMTVPSSRDAQPSRLIYWGADRAVLTATLLDRKTTGGVKLP